MLLRAPEKPVALEVEVPDWTDGGFEDVANDFDIECSALNLPKGEADELRDKLKEALKIQEKNIYRPGIYRKLIRRSPI